MSVPTPWGWLGYLSPALILFFILKVTGIPPTEAQALASRGDRGFKDGAEPVSTPVRGSRWSLVYWPAATGGVATELGIVGLAAGLPDLVDHGHIPLAFQRHVARHPDVGQRRLPAAVVERGRLAGVYRNLKVNQAKPRGERPSRGPRW